MARQDPVRFGTVRPGQAAAGYAEVWLGVVWVRCSGGKPRLMAWCGTVR